MTRPHAALVRTYVPALVGAGASVLLARILPVSPFFLVPIGVVAAMRGALPVGITVLLAVVFNFSMVLFSLGSLAARNLPSLFADSAYFLVLVAFFAWAVFENGGAPRRFVERLSHRLILSSFVSAAALYPIMALARHDQSLVDFFNIQASAIADAFKAGAGSDVVQRSLMEKELTAETISKTFGLIISRGAVLGHLIFFGVSWRFSQVIASFRDPFLRLRHPFVFFRNNAFLVWFLIASLLGVMAATKVSNEVLSVVSWNLMLACVFLYVVQGLAVVMYNLARPGVPLLLRPLLALFIAIAVFQPGINAAVGIAFAVVGVAENWLPLRAPIHTEPPSTPEA